MTFEHFWDVLPQNLSIFIVFFSAALLIKVLKKLVSRECVFYVADNLLVELRFDIVSLQYRWLLIA